MSTTEQSVKQGITKDDVRDMFAEFTRNRGVSDHDGGTQLMAENFQHRADKRELNTKIDELTRNQVPKGAVVLTGDDVQRWTDLQKLLVDGKKPEDIAKALTDAGQMTEKLQKLEREQLLSKVAEAEGWSATNLARLAAGMDLTVEEVEDEVDDPDSPGEKKKVKAQRGLVVQKDAQGAVIGKKRVAEELKDFLPSLQLEKKDDKGGKTANDKGGTKGAGTSVAKQGTGGKAPSGTKTVSTDFIKRRYGADKKTGQGAG